MEAPNNEIEKQKAVDSLTRNTYALQVVLGAPLVRRTVGGSSNLTELVDAPRNNTSSDTSSGRLSLGLLETMQQMIMSVICAHLAAAPPAPFAAPRGIEVLGTT
ncbi:UNVERIFIED_CONTAM: hypothetical protein Slati_1489400 [Sesamum latifolium]|uniref:Uncharacterized protein n=1 Tax=Sesamum latifolium TaxID=2727402 RepID=A0AAW2X765_9LAMI